MLSVVVILAVITAWIVTNTDYGRERSRRFIVNLLNAQTHGIVKVDAMHGNLLSQAMLVGLPCVTTNIVMPPAASSMPTVISGRGPILPFSRPASGATNRMISVIGIERTPASIAEYPLMFWK